MTTSNWAHSALDHARFLSEQIGPRGATTPQEKRAAEYARDQLQQAGLNDARVQSFRSTRSGWLPLTIAFSVAVWGTILCWGSFYLTRRPAFGAIIGALLCALSAWTIYAIATQRRHPLIRWLSAARSHNAVGRIAATGTATRQVVLVANLDTYPDSWIFRTPRRTRLFYDWLRVASVSLIVSIGLYTLGALEAWNFAFVAAGVCGLVQSAGILLTIQADQGDFDAGVNDNASGVGVVLALAQQLHAAPLAQTEVWIVCAGGHTLGNSGLQAFMRQQPALALTAWFIGCQRVGRGGQVAYVEREGWLPQVTPREVRDLIGHAITDRLGHQPQAVSTLQSTPIGAAMRRGCKAACIVLEDQAEKSAAAGEAPQLQTAALLKAGQAVHSLLTAIDR